MIRALLRASLFALPISLVHAARATEADETAIKGRPFGKTQGGDLQPLCDPPLQATTHALRSTLQFNLFNVVTLITTNQSATGSGVNHHHHADSFYRLHPQSDPNAECAPYGYAPVTEAVNAGEFPIVWAPATLLPNDANANAKWQSIQGSVPNIAPKGTNSGNFSTVQYTSDDPDCWWTWGQCTTSKKSGIPPDIARMPEPQTLGYGFDDGPNCSHNAFYDYLTQQNQKATMFYIGSNVLDWPLEAQRALTDGHEICAHSWSHRYMTSFSSPDAFAELYYSVRFVKAIKLVTGVTPTCWRPPFGDVDDRIRAIAHGLGLRTILWKYDSQDWQYGSTQGVTIDTVDGHYQDLITGAQNGTFDTAGAIMLTHELNNFTMSEAIKFYPQLKAAFKNIVPVGVGLNISQPYQEQGYKLPSFSQYIEGKTSLATDPAAVSAAQALNSASATAPASSSASATAHTSDSGSLRLGGVSTVLLGLVGAGVLGSI
ncbi:hypothetical protein D9619_004268 [Psilocybe cf. subviscida]|uniref:chitin deacetylase n=1 Tax=Psilocybe cf. subviscida TaxID=2480587 RepID=A0A8H5F8P5_9AGAR|nr:hypothetical protein D9619_004268 [Psilocybe cf. subviscida]